MESKDTRTCLNCGHVTTGNFCSNCGQKISLTKIRFKEVILDFLGTVFNIDSPFPITLKGLFTQPGELVRQFLMGHRKSYYAPIRYLVVCLFINILIGELIGFDPIENQEAMDPRGQNEANNTWYQVGRFLANSLNLFTLIFPICIGFTSRLFFWRMPFNLAERSVFGFFISGQYAIVALLPIALTKLSPYFFLLHYLFTILYLTYAFYSFHNINGKFVRMLKSLFAALFSFASFYVLSFTLAYVIMKLLNRI